MLIDLQEIFARFGLRWAATDAFDPVSLFYYMVGLIDLRIRSICTRATAR